MSNGLDHRAYRGEDRDRPSASARVEEIGEPGDVYVAERLDVVVIGRISTMVWIRGYVRSRRIASGYLLTRSQDPPSAHAPSWP